MEKVKPAGAQPAGTDGKKEFGGNGHPNLTTSCPPLSTDPLGEILERYNAALAAGDGTAAEELRRQYVIAWPAAFAARMSERVAAALESRPLPCTGKQLAFIDVLISKHGRPAYLAARERAGIPDDTKILNFTRRQARRLIEEIKRGQQ